MSAKIAATVLHTLASARLLLAKGANPGATQPGGFAPLHSAAHNGNRALVELLLASGAPRDARTDKGKTARVLAEENGHATLAAMLES